MGLENAGIEYSEKFGIFADKNMLTTNNHVFAIGDCVAMATSAEQAKT